MKVFVLLWGELSTVEALPHSQESPLANGTRVTGGRKLNAGKIINFLSSFPFLYGTQGGETEGTLKEILSTREREGTMGTETCARSFGPTENPAYCPPADGAERLRMPSAAHLARHPPSFSYLRTPTF